MTAPKAVVFLRKTIACHRKYGKVAKDKGGDTNKKTQKLITIIKLKSYANFPLLKDG